MKKDFFKKNWIYIALLCFIAAVNIYSRFEAKKEPAGEVKKESPSLEGAENPTLFVEFEEAQRRSKKIEEVLKGDIPLYILYISANLLVFMVLLLGFVIDGYFIFGIFRKKNIFRKSPGMRAPPWKISDVFRIIILALAFGYVFYIAFGVFLDFLQSVTNTKFRFYENENFRMIFDTIILDFIVFAVVLGFLWKIYGRRLASLGFAKKNMARNLFYGVSGYVGVLPVIFIIGILVYAILNLFKIKPPPQPIVGLFLGEENVLFIATSGVIAAIFGPVIEEIFFRGVMYNAVKRKLGVFRAILITSVLFSFLHTHAMTYFLVGFMPIAILGAVLAYLYEKTGSLIPSVTLHMLNNLGSILMVFLFKYFNSLVQ